MVSLLLACTASGLDDTGPPADDSADTGPADAGPDAPEAAESRSGAGVEGETGYLGSEVWRLVADSGSGADICQLQYTLASTAARTDCADCAWAWDLEISGAVVLAETAPGCAASLGDPAGLDGTGIAYGYAPNYFGHAQVLMVFDGAVWQAVAFGDMDEETGDFAYDWEVGYRAY